MAVLFSFAPLPPLVADSVEETEPDLNIGKKPFVKREQFSKNAYNNYLVVQTGPWLLPYGRQRPLCRRGGGADPWRHRPEAVQVEVGAVSCLCAPPCEVGGGEGAPGGGGRGGGGGGCS